MKQKYKLVKGKPVELHTDAKQGFIVVLMVVLLTMIAVNHWSGGSSGGQLFMQMLLVIAVGRATILKIG